MASVDPVAHFFGFRPKESQLPDVLHPPTLPASTLRIDPNLLAHPKAGLISDKLYSGFIEHLGRGIYGGIVDDPKNPSPADLLVKQDDGQELTKGRAGWRKDVMEVLGKDGELEMPMLRWPGGNFVSNYHWQDGIGPIENRPKRIELAWLGTESNQFGTDEFIDYARALGVEPYLCLNMGTGTYEEALAWLEYCNGTGDTHWANLRRKNTGRDEPHGVKLWGLGNEMWGPWQVGNLSATDYAKKAKQWAHGLRLVDPTIKLVACGNQGNSEWDREVLQELIHVVDYHSIHFYSMLGHDKVFEIAGHEYEKNVFGPAAAERGIEICQSLIDLAKIEKKYSARDVKICYDEWNVWDEAKAPGAVGLEQTYDFTDALAFCAWLHLLVRKHDIVGIACLAQSVNVIAPVMTRPNGLLFQTTYYPLRLFSKYMKDGVLLNMAVNAAHYAGPTYPAWIQNIGETPYIDSVAVKVETKDGVSIRIAVLNRHPKADWTANLDILDFDVASAEVHELYHDDLAAVNSWDNPNNVFPTVTKLEGKEWAKEAGSYIVKKHSWSFFMINGKLKA